MRRAPFVPADAARVAAAAARAATAAVARAATVAAAVSTALLLAVGSAAPAANRLVVLKTVTLHSANFATIEDAIVVLDGDRIQDLGDDVGVPPDADTIECHHLHVYPGLIAAGGALPADSLGLLARAREHGVLAALAIPDGGPVRGVSTLLHTAVQPGEARELKSPVALHIQWPMGSSAEAPGVARTDRPGARGTAAHAPVPRSASGAGVGALRREFDEARAFGKAQRESRPLKRGSRQHQADLHAIDEALRGMIPVFIHVDGLEPIRTALRFVDEQHLRHVVLVGGRESWLLADSLKTRGIAVVAIAPSPRAEGGAPGDSFPLPARLLAAGVSFCVAPPGRADVGDLLRCARLAMASGLPREEALRSISQYAARLVGADKMIGTLQPGLYADLVIANGDLLDPGTHIEQIWVMGRPVGTPAK
jgi:imidazolonepropionase-like amidohydrolase